MQSVKEQMDAADEADASDGEPDSSPAKLAGNLTVLPATVHFCPQLVPMLAAVHSTHAQVQADTHFFRLYILMAGIQE